MPNPKQSPYHCLIHHNLLIYKHLIVDEEGIKSGELATLANRWCHSPLSLRDVVFEPSKSISSLDF